MQFQFDIKSSDLLKLNENCTSVAMSVSEAEQKIF